jgi:hypothetical protein
MDESVSLTKAGSNIKRVKMRALKSISCMTKRQIKGTFPSIRFPSFWSDEEEETEQILLWY